MIALKTSYYLCDRAFIVLMVWLTGCSHATEQSDRDSLLHKTTKRKKLF